MKASAGQRARASRLSYVKRLATGFGMNGPVAADLPGFDKPGIIRGNGAGDHAPDIEARLGPVHCVIAVETAETLADPLTADRWRTFSSWAGEPGRMFLVAVPPKHRQGAESRLDRLGIVNAEVITV